MDAQIDAGPLTPFIAAYQKVVSLKLGELWAIPIMLRLGLIENLQRVTSRLILAREDRDRANLWVDRLQAMIDEGDLVAQHLKDAGRNEDHEGAVRRQPRELRRRSGQQTPVESQRNRQQRDECANAGSR